MCRRFESCRGHLEDQPERHLSSGYVRASIDRPVQPDATRSRRSSLPTDYSRIDLGCVFPGRAGCFRQDPDW
ncbi:hypothetical protein F6X68_08535 [Micromonospora sp. AMSO12t]|nr:hypothetical protein F6X68_08535 [Micromonospora sp. AMSO12t]